MSTAVPCCVRKNRQPSSPNSLIFGRRSWARSLASPRPPKRSATRSPGAKPLERFLTDGRIEIDSNIVERAIRPQTITRKNSLFAGSEGGGRTWATVATLLQTAKMNNVDPLDWLSQTLTRIAQGWPVSELEALMPWNFRPDAIS